MVELVSLKNVRTEDKLILLRELGYDSDGTFVTDKEGEKVYDRYIDEPVRVNNMLILPGSTVILDDNPLSVVSYLEDFPNVF